MVEVQYIKQYKSITMKLRKHLFIGLVALLIAGGYLPASAQSGGPIQDINEVYADIEFDMPRVKEPTFKDYAVKITDFGAVADGLTENTQAFADAIENVSQKGGGKVVVPRGIWLTGPIVLKSNINLHVEEGALIVFSPDKSKYPLVKTSFEGLETYRSQSPISGRDLENVAITGSGVIDGSGGVWRHVKRGKVSPSQWNALVRSGGVVSDDEKEWYPSETFKEALKLTGNFNVPAFKTREEHEAVKEFLRPVMVSLINCKKVLLDGPTFQNSPAWNIHPLMCEDVTIRNLTVRNPWYSQNGDGLDLESCKNVVIYNNNFDVGDDAICFKSGKDEDGRRRGIPTENVIVKNNIVYHGHGGFVVGSEMSGGVKNVHVSNCTFIGTDVGLRFKSTRGRGGVVEDIYISNINMIGIPTEAIRFNLFYGGKSPVPEEGEETTEVNRELMPVTVETPSFRNITIKNIVSTGGGAGAIFQGLPEMKVQNVRMENMTLEAKKGITLIDAEGITLKDVKMFNETGAALTIYNSSDVDVSNFSFNEREDGPEVRVLGNSTTAISLDRNSVSASQLETGKEVKKKAVKFKK